MLSWNRIRYTLWAPVYDLAVRGFASKRRRSIELLDPKPGERVLIVGAGTGLDLDCIPAGPILTAIDLTPAMLEKLRRRARRLGREVDARTMDAQALDFPDAAFDAAILHLILEVVPDPVRCVRETARVLRPGGRAVVFDKFIPDDSRPPLLLRALNPVARFLASNLTRRLGPILAGSGLRIEREGPSAFWGYVRTVLLRKD